MFLCISYMAQLVPWMLVTRCTFIYHYFPSVPFITLMVGYSMYRFVTYKEDARYQKIAKRVCVTYAVLSVCLFVLFYPVLSGYPFDAEFVVKYLRWLGRWQLVSM